MTCRGPARARRGPEMADLEVIDGGAVLVRDGLVEAVGRYREVKDQADDAEVIEIDGVLFPGFVDAHTHAVFGMARLDDYERRARGMDYKAIAAEGGGILSSVRDQRSRSADELRDLTSRRLHHLLAHGTTTVEVKSGYGLDTATELGALAVIGSLTAGPPAVVPTFLGAHEVPLEYRSRREDYVRLVIDEMLPAVAEQGIARFCDVFCEPGVFTPGESRRILEAARGHGLGLKLHADELDGSGGAELAAALDAVSADHLARISEEGITALAGSGTVAVLLPGTMLFLGRADRAPARALIDRGAAVALATDFNPGSSPAASLPLMATLGVSQLRMVPAEAVLAITANGAAAVGEAGTRGQIAPGFRADLALLAVRDWRELVYWYGSNLVAGVWIAGAACHPAGATINFLV
ncbi:MAG: imidazolonepropionase [Gemmatimonadota bacterium]|nr:imidazolonepropionase [Gemmatimonadota bacterium]